MIRPVDRIKIRRLRGRPLDLAADPVMRPPKVQRLVELLRMSDEDRQKLIRMPKITIQSQGDDQ